MKIIDLQEGITDTLYHVTRLSYAAKIVSEDQFNMRPVFRQSTERNISHDNKMFYMSTARSPRGGYIANQLLYPNETGRVLFVLDGKKLSHNYKGGAVSYFSQRDRIDNPSLDEQEDRIYATVPYINHAVKYIKEAHVVIAKDATYGARKWLIMLQRGGFPVYLHFDGDDAISLKKTNDSLSEISWHDNRGVRDVDDAYDVRQSDKSIARNRNQAYVERSAMWSALIQTPIQYYDRFPDIWKSFLTYMVNGDHYDDKGHADMLRHGFNYHQDDYQSVAIMMHRLRLRDPLAVVQYVKNKWKEVIPDEID